MSFDVDSFSWDSWKPTENAVLLFLFRDDQVLLIRKKRGLGTGKINGPGGRLEPGESFEKAAIRETIEETGIVPSDLIETAELSFVFTNGYSLYVRVFFAYNGSGRLQECDEAAPFWHPVNQIPYEQMWQDDPIWIPLALEGKYVVGRFIFDEDTMLTQSVETKERPQFLPTTFPSRG